MALKMASRFIALPAVGLLLLLSLAGLLFSNESSAEGVSPKTRSCLGRNRQVVSASQKCPRNLIRVPLVRQSTDYTCGVAALQSVLGFYGIDSREDALSKELKTNKVEGTSYHEIAKYCRSHGFQVLVRKGLSFADLKTFLDHGQPVICLIQAWGDDPEKYASAWDDGHYVVAVGYDSGNFYFMDPSTLGSYTYIPSAEFQSRWHDTDGKERLFNFGMIISRKGAVFTPDVCKPLE